MAATAPAMRDGDGMDFIGSNEIFDRALEEALSTGGEVQDFDFKETLDLSTEDGKAKLVKTVASFANAGTGGWVFVGVRNDRTIRGLTPDEAAPFEQTRLSDLLRNCLAPEPSCQARRRDRRGDIGDFVVVIRVAPFEDLPVFVVRGVAEIRKGTLFVRTTGARSEPVHSTDDVRRVFTRLIQNHAEDIAGHVRRVLSAEGVLEAAEAVRASEDEQGHPPPRDCHELVSLRELVGPASVPYFETFFFPVRRLSLSLDQIRGVIPHARIDRTKDSLNDYPAGAPPSAGGGQPTSQGWLVTGDRGDWAFGKEGTFVDRQIYWEDQRPSKVKWVGLWFVSARICYLLHLLRRCADFLGLVDSERFVVGAALTGTEGRYLAAEDNSDFHRARPAMSKDVMVEAVTTVGDVRQDQRAVAIPLVEQIAWDMERTEMTGSQIANAIDIAARNFRGLFPEK